MTFAQKMFSFEGRIGRQDFWIGTLIIWGTSIALGILLVALAFGPLMALAGQEELLQSEDPAVVLPLIAPLLGYFGVYMVFQLAIIWPSLALCVKRLHDRDQSGWWVMLFVGEKLISWIPFVGILAWLGARTYWLVNLGILEGSPGPNKYGLAPGARNGEVFA